MKKETVILILYMLISFSCKKEAETEKCGCDGTKTEFIEKIFGIVIETDDGFEILTDEKGLLIPCSELAGDFKNGSQPVTVSGTLKVPCKKIPYDFEVTPIEISELKLRDSTYDKTDITLTIIKSEDYGYDPGFGYFIDDHRSGLRISQPHIPAVSGLIPFNTPDQATKTGVLVIYLLRKNSGPLPSLSIEILKYINIIN
ncbi:MAG TPA: DUF4907 domain-containing protein [Chitinophagaceae bacterium]